jgi:hypothetical protein
MEIADPELRNRSIKPFKGGPLSASEIKASSPVGPKMPRMSLIEPSGSNKSSGGPVVGLVGIEGGVVSG